ncbi:MAG: T9SS type A sorting domain-containing protein, partial [Salinivirgaceae bacterium]|nr:T9SS type A sorting domain-containing protein [Salinivirgaceae bacterium]
GNGTLEATVDGIAIVSADMVEETKDVLFTAIPAVGYRVKTWTLDGAVVEGNATANYTVSNLSASINVTVEFEIIPEQQILLLVEDFDYPNGAVLSENGWTAHSGVGTNSPAVQVPGLSFTGYMGSDVGGAAVLNNNGEDINRTFEGKTEGSVYAAFVVETAATNAEGYFFHFAPSPFATTYFSRVWVNATGTGIGMGGSAPAEYQPIIPGTPALVVVKYDIDSKTSSLFVFDQFPTEEPAVAHATASETMSSVGAIGLRQYNTSQDVIVDGIRVATTWEQAVKASGTQSSFAVNYNVVGTGGELAAAVDGTAIATGDLVTEGKSILFTASPSDGFKVLAWTLNSVVVEDNLTNNFTVSNISAETNVTVAFTNIPQYTASITIVGNGSVNVNGAPMTEAIVVYEGTEINLEAIAANNWGFEGWTGDLVSSNAVENIVMDSNKEITVTFVDLSVYYTVNFEALANGTIEALVNAEAITSGDEVLAGENVEFSATPEVGYRVKNWKLNNVVVVGNTSSQFMVEALAENISVTVEFELLPENQYSATFSVVNANGTIAAFVDGVEIASGDMIYEGEEITYIATPAVDYTVKEWILNGVIVANNTTNTYIQPAIMANSIVTVEFETTPQYSLTINLVGNGVVNVNDVPYTSALQFEEGTVVNLEAIANQGNLFENWSGDLVSVNANETVLMDGNKVITANFRAFVSATINPTSGNFDEANPADLITVITWNDASSVDSIVMFFEGESDLLVENEAYTIVSINAETARITFLMSDKLASIAKETYAFVCNIYFDLGNHAEYTINATFLDEFYVTFDVEEADGTPIADAVLTFDGMVFDAGDYEVGYMPVGSYDYSVAKTGYVSESGTLNVIDADIDQLVVLQPVITYYTVTFNVTSIGNPVSDANILVNETNITTNASGQATIELSDGSYAYAISKANFDTFNGTVNVAGAAKTVNVELVSGIDTQVAVATQLYPNPVVDVLTLNRASTDNVMIEIYTVNGSLILSQEWNTETLTLNVSDMKTGLFQIRIIGKNDIETLRFIKQ